MTKHAQCEFAEFTERRYLASHTVKVAHLVLARDLVFPTAVSLCGRERWVDQWLGGTSGQAERAASLPLCKECWSHLQIDDGGEATVEVEVG